MEGTPFQPASQTEHALELTPTLPEEGVEVPKAQAEQLALSERLKAP